MKIKMFLFSTFLLLAIIAFGQPGSCADSSFRMRYIFGSNGANFSNIPDTAGTNIFAGYFGIGVRGIPLMKTTWGDSILWARQISLTGYIRNAVACPDGGIIVCGPYGDIANKAELFVGKIDSNGRVLWMKKVTTLQPFNYGNGGIYKSIDVTNNAIYLELAYDAYDIIAKLDLNGNIIWSRGFVPIAASNVGMPKYGGNSLVCMGRYVYDPTTSATATVLTKLSDVDGSFIESWQYKVATNDTIKWVLPTDLKFNADNTYTIAGLAYITTNGNQTANSLGISNSLFDANLNTTRNYYYYYTKALVNPLSNTGFNNKKQHTLLGADVFNNYSNYFITFDKNDEILRTRNFVIPSTFGPQNYLAINLDDKQNVHFLFHYQQSGKQVTEYARVSNFAPTGTLGCFGKDTSLFTKVSFTLTKEPFVWPNTTSNLLQSVDVPYYEDTAFVTKELVCKITSLCNKVTISGPANACVGQPVRYTITRNNGCYKNAEWNVDTTVANILNIEGDSAINLSFKKIFTGHIYALLTDCVVRDSFLVSITPSPVLSFIKRDSLLCPGKTITLNALTGFINYQWQDGTSGGTYVITKPGLYKVTATNYCGNISSDSILVTNSDTSLNIISSQTICLYDTAFIVLPNDVTNVLWQPNTNSLLNNKTLSLYPQQNTVYTINAERMPNCTLTKQTAVVIKVCPQTFFIPNSFTPNNDNRNDVFKPSVSLPLAFYHMQIFNRYGQNVFETSNQYNGWDGMYKGRRQPIEGYIYQCSYRFNNATQKIINGYFILLR